MAVFKPGSRRRAEQEEIIDPTTPAPSNQKSGRYRHADAAVVADLPGHGLLRRATGRAVPHPTVDAAVPSLLDSPLRAAGPEPKLQVQHLPLDRLLPRRRNPQVHPHRSRQDLPRTSSPMVCSAQGSVHRLGLDDVWMVQPSCHGNDTEQIPVFLTQFTMDSVAARFPYLVKQNLDEADEVAQVAQLSWRIIECDVNKPFVSSRLEFVPLPVMHGEDYVCLGFLFGRRARVAYLSDVSRILPRTEQEISKYGAGQLDLLILDTNMLHGLSLDVVRKICPKNALLTGMNHEFDHYRENQMLAEWSLREGIPVQLAHDGQRIFIDL